MTIDPSGRRGRALRAIATATAIVTAGYLGLVLLAVLGAPLPPAADVPLPPRLGSDSVTGTVPITTMEPWPSSVTSTRRSAPPTAPSRTVAPRSTATPVPVITTSDRRVTKPSEPPGQGKAPTTPPGHG